MRRHGDGIRIGSGLLAARDEDHTLEYVRGRRSDSLLRGDEHTVEDVQRATIRPGQLSGEPSKRRSHAKAGAKVLGISGVLEVLLSSWSSDLELHLSLSLSLSLSLELDLESIFDSIF